LAFRAWPLSNAFEINRLVFERLFTPAEWAILDENQPFVAALGKRMDTTQELLHVLRLGLDLLGDPTPSESDIKVTRDLIRAGQLLKIEILDHVIVGTNTQRSLRELGYCAV
jgi:DNA repair protein RadC